MAVKASISSGYLWRLGIIAVALIAVAGWFLYDGAVKYPEQKEIYETRIRIEQENPDEWRAMWADMVDTHGWPENPPERTDRDIFVQYLCAAITLPLGLLFGGNFLRASRRWVASDEQGLHTSWGQHAPWDSLRSIDKARWQTKGIAIVHYDDNGTEKRLTLDDWKFDREPVATMVKQVDDQLDQAGDGEGSQATPTSEPLTADS